MREHAGRFHQLGAEVVVVGNGTVAQARAFREEHALDLPLYTDPSRRVHRTVGFRHGLASTLSPTTMIRGIRARRKGFSQEFIAGDAQQQGGVLVIAPGDEVIFAYRSRGAGDHPAPEGVVAALERWAQGRRVEAPA